MMIKDRKLLTLTILSLSILGACSPNIISDNTNKTSQTTNPVVLTKTATTNNTMIDWSNLPTTEITLTNEGLTITEAGTYILTGTTTGGVQVKTTGNVRLILAGTTISSATSAGIYIENANVAVIELQDGTTNTVTDTSQRSNTDIGAAIFATSDLTISGTGNLTVAGRYEDGIASKDNLTISSGNITVSAVDDGIRGRDSVVITGGTVDITAGGDGIKSTNDEDTAKGYTTISGGNITVNAGDDGIKAETSLTINGGAISVPKSAEGLEGTNVTINGGTINIYATDDGINASSDVQEADIFVKITGGDVMVSVGQGDTDAIDSNGNLYITGGTMTITAQSAFDFDGTVEFTGGKVTVNGQVQTQITATGPGGGGFPGGFGNGRR